MFPSAIAKCQRPDRAAVVACALVAWTALAGSAAAQTPLTTQLVVGSGLASPLMVKSPPGDFQRLMVVQRGGRVRLIKNGTLLATDFLDITSQVLSNDERGLLDIAFHPNYAANGYFYVRYTATNGQTTVRRFTRSANPDVADPASGLTIIKMPCGLSFHIGGSIEFGRDGYLYITVGDCTDTTNSQNIDSLHGKILRIDVNSDDFPADSERNYRNPPDNPYAGATPGLDEIWARGLRNPFRMSMDRATGGFWIADVGNIGPEEIDFQPVAAGGRNYAWPCKEGTTCWPAQTACACGQADIVDPVYDYTHATGHCAVIGGRVYRGCAIPDLAGTYFFGDFCTGAIWSFRYVNNQVTSFTTRTLELDPPGPPSIGAITGFGEDARGELYIVQYTGGVYRIVPVP